MITGCNTEYYQSCSIIARIVNCMLQKQRLSKIIGFRGKHHSGEKNE